jgi:NhaA family Na+:H+ antiporter
MLGGIGFTMSIFITLLAFDDDFMVNHSKIAVLLASTIAGLAGFICLKMTLKNTIAEILEEET